MAPRAVQGLGLALVIAAGGCATGGEGSKDPAKEAAPRAASDGEAEEPGEAAFQPPSIVSIRIVETVARPWKQSGHLWDLNAVADPESIRQLALALGASERHASVVAFLGKLVADGWGPPDQLGAVSFFSGGQWSATAALGSRDTNLENQFVSDWLQEWNHIPVEETMRISVSLIDEDFEYDDTIGTVELNYDDVIAAVQAKQVYYAPVDDQGSGNVLFVGISVAVEQP